MMLRGLVFSLCNKKDQILIGISFEMCKTHSSCNIRIMFTAIIGANDWANIVTRMKDLQQNFSILNELRRLLLVIALRFSFAIKLQKEN